MQPPFLEALSFTVPYLTPPSVNHLKEPCRFTDRDGHYRLGFKLTKAVKAYYDAVAIFAQGLSLDPETDAARKRTLYLVEMHVYLGHKQRIDADNCGKAGLDALQYARVIHSDAAVETCTITVHKDERENPRTVYHITRTEKN
jgi:Holliday junction resolvase RusA-like endonuclease